MINFIKILSLQIKILLIATLVISMSGCKNTKTYHEEDVYVENYVHFENKSKQPLNGILISKFKTGEVRAKWPYKNCLVDGDTEN